MQFRIKEKFTEYPTPWKKRFAIFPTKIARTDDGYLFVWLSEYERREIDDYSWEVRQVGGQAGVHPLKFESFPDGFDG